VEIAALDRPQASAAIVEHETVINQAIKTLQFIPCANGGTSLWRFMLQWTPPAGSPPRSNGGIPYASRPAAEHALRHLLRDPIPVSRPAQHARAGRRAAAGGHRDCRGRQRDGWFGAQGERYFGPDRLSAFVGAGYTPSLDQYEPSGLTFAAGLRGYTAGFKHRGFVEASVSQIFTESNALEPGRRLYGPGLAAGYHYASRGGFTLMTSLGVGFGDQHL
jgi:hypothetical protein